MPPLLGPDPLVAPSPPASGWKTETETRQRGNPLLDDSPEFLVLRGQYRTGALSLTTEMGDLQISETGNTISDVSRRGARVAVQTGGSSTKARLATFAGTKVSTAGTDGVLVGASGELSLFAERARIKTVFLSGRESINPCQKGIAEKRGDVVGFIAAIEPYPGILAAEAEADFSRYQSAAVTQSSSSDVAYKVKIGGAVQKYRYSALYEHTGAKYQLVAGDGPQADSEGVLLKMGADFPLHVIDLNLSRYNDNLDDSDLYPRSYRYEAGVDYSFTGIESLPLALQYRKTLLNGVQESDGSVVRDSDADSVTTKANYLLEKWDFGARWNYQQRSDRLTNRREMVSNTVGFSPKFTSGNLAVAPDISLSRARDFLAGQDTQKYAVSLGVNGNLLRKMLTYDVKGGYSNEETNGQLLGRETIGLKFKVGCDLKRVLRNPLFSAMGVRGEYNRTITETQNGSSDYAFLFMLDSSKSLF